MLVQGTRIAFWPPCPLRASTHDKPQDPDDMYRETVSISRSYRTHGRHRIPQTPFSTAQPWHEGSVGLDLFAGHRYRHQMSKRIAFVYFSTVCWV